MGNVYFALPSCPAHTMYRNGSHPRQGSRTIPEARSRTAATPESTPHRGRGVRGRACSAGVSAGGWNDGLGRWGDKKPETDIGACDWQFLGGLIS